MPSPHEKDEMGWWKDYFNGYDFYDDVDGDKPLPWEEVLKARKLEMDFFRKVGVYTKVHKEMAKKDGCKIISTRWIDTNKGDKNNPNFRSRLVGREIKTDSRLDLFSATPPLEVMKFLISNCAQSQDDPRGAMRLATIDIKRAYFYAPARRNVYISIPVEDRMPGDEHMVGKLNLSLCGDQRRCPELGERIYWIIERARFR